MDVRLKKGCIPHRAYTDEATGIGSAAFLVKSILLMGADPQVAAAVVQLVAVDMIDLAIRIREQEPMKHTVRRDNA